MKLSKWWILCMVFLWMPSQVHAQQSISIEQAVELFKENSLQQELARLEALRKKGEARQYKSYLNPEVSVFTEQLHRGSLDYDETTYQVSQPLELLGQPFLRNKSADYTSQAAELEFEYAQARLIQQVKSLYAEYWYLQKKRRIYEEAVAVIDRVLETAKARREEGTVSGIQVQRFSIEQSKYRKAGSETEIRLQKVGNQLKTMIGGPDEEINEITVSEELEVRELSLTKEALQAYAFEQRADIKALSNYSEASRLKAKVEHKERLPDLNIDFGYKSQSDGSEGFVVGGSIKLPMFNQNSGNIAVAEAKYRSMEHRLYLKEKEIANQVDLAFERVQQLYNQWEMLKGQSLSPDMLETARISYQEGSYSLVELLDATKAYTEGREFRYRLIADYNQALFQLDTFTSGKIFSTKTNSDL